MCADNELRTDQHVTALRHLISHLKALVGSHLPSIINKDFHDLHLHSVRANETTPPWIQIPDE